MIYNAERPISFDQMIGQELIVENIRNQSIKGQFFPVFILCGQYGSGKTTMARIIAMAANCEHKDERGNPCGKCDSCRSVLEHSSEGIIEIDGASNNGVDNIRKLLGQAATVGIYQKKIIVIDEAHMLSKSAFNALLITLENPPRHCIFILCTTEKEALPETVVSRAPVYVFGKISDGLIKEHILRVAKKNEIGISKDAAGLLARYANGAMRNALQLLEHLSLQKAAGEVIEDTDVIRILGLSSLEQRASFLDGCLSGDIKMVVSTLRSCELRGIAIRTFIQDVLEMNTDLLLMKAGAEVVGTEFYLGKLRELISNEDAAIVTANKMLNVIASTPANQLSVERIGAAVIAELYLPKPVATAKSVRNEETVMESIVRKANIPEAAESGDAKGEISTEEKASQAEAAEDISLDMEGFQPIPDDAPVPFMEEDTMREQTSSEDMQLAASDDSDIAFGFGLFGGGLFSGSMMEGSTGKKKSTKRETTDLFGEMAVAGAAVNSLNKGSTKVDSLDSGKDTAATSSEEERLDPEESKEKPSLLKDSIPVDQEGRMNWDEAAAQGLVLERDKITLPKPETQEELDAYYEAEKLEKEEQVEEEDPEEKGFATRSDLIQANEELQELLKNPGFKILFHKARYVEQNYHIYLYYKSQAMVTAAKIFLAGSKGITAQIDKGDM